MKQHHIAIAINNNSFSEKSDSECNKKFIIQTFQYQANPGQPTLEYMIKSRTNLLNTIFNFPQNPNLSIKIRKIETTSNPLLFVAFSDPLASLPVTPQKNQKDLQDVPFADTDHLFIAIRDNWIHASLQIGSTLSLPRKLRFFIKLLHIDNDIIEMVDSDNLSLLKKEGFRSLEIAGIFSSDNLPIKPKGFIARNLNKFVGNAPPISSLPLVGLLSISSDNNHEIAEIVSENIAEIIGELDDDFYIVTGKNRKIKGGDFKAKKEYYLKRYGTKSVFSSGAFAVLSHHLSKT